MSREANLRSAERAIKRLAKLAWRIRHKDLADWMIQGDKVGECRAGDAQFVGEFLSDTASSGISAYEAAKPYRTCAICGTDSRRMEGRSHARYCSDKCRQKAYRLRCVSGDGSTKRSVTNEPFVMDRATDLQAET